MGSNLDFCNLTSFVNDKPEAVQETEAYCIPLVFHIINHGEILEEDIETWVSGTNDYFRGLIAGTHDTHIEFVLANVDPNGNCTEGVNKVSATYPNTNNISDEELVAFIHEQGLWDPSAYINVWVSDLTCTDGGCTSFAAFPFDTESTQGVVINFGMHIFDQKTLAHEFGHSLGLLHPQGCVISSTPLEDACARNCGLNNVASLTIGDYVDDTAACVIYTGSQNNCSDEVVDVCFTCLPDNSAYEELDYPKTNLMGGLNNCRNTFSAGQAKRMHYHLNTAQRDLWYPGYQINDEKIVDESVKFHKDVNIYAGGRLVLRSEVVMAEGKSIIVHEGGQLVVEGGHIRGCSNDDGPPSRWSGIKVKGRNQDGFDVEIVENVDGHGSLIEDVDGPAISTGELNIIPSFPPIITNSSITNNGKVKIEGATFKNVESMLLLSSSLPRANGSEILNSIQIGGSAGIQNSNCLGVDVFDNKFIALEKECIVSLNGSFLLADNYFDAGINDVVLTNFFKGVRSEIFSNDFHGPNGGIRCAGSTVDFHDIIGNTFHKSESFSLADLDIYTDGASHYRIENGNYFTGVIGVSSRANGANNGIVAFNEFNENFIGVYPRDGNPQYSFSENCFNSIIVDASIHGAVSDEIGGTQGPAANNCFTHKGVWTSNAVQDIGGDPDVFTYLEPDDNGFDCRDAFLAPASVVRDFVDDDNSAVCEGTGGESNRPSDTNGLLAETLILSNNFDGAINAMSTSNEEENFINQISIRLNEGDLEEVNSLLNSQIESNENIADFKNVVSIGMELLLNENLTESAKNVMVFELEQMSLKPNSVSGFAQALYYRVTGEFVDNLDMSLIEQNNSINERKLEEDKENTRDFSIYPNPTKDVVLIKSDTEIEKLTVYNVIGSLIIELKNLDSSTTLDLNNFEDGIFYIHIHDERGKEYIEKVIKN